MNLLSDTNVEKNIASGDIAAFFQLLRDGNAEASCSVVKQLEPLIRREARVAMRDRRLSRIFDSIDVSQSVFASFFRRFAGGQFEVEELDQLVSLLVVMARHKAASRCRAEMSLKRDFRRVDTADSKALGNLATTDRLPSETVSDAEVAEQAMRQMTPQEQTLLQMRQSGLSWKQVAQRSGGTPQARRLQLMRVLTRIRSTMRR